jgi:hypothetical protein
MGLPAGTFVGSRTAPLEISYSGQWVINEADWGSGVWELKLRGKATYGDQVRTVVLDILTASASIVFSDYVAGSAVTVEMEEISYHIVGAGTIAAVDLMILCKLL